MKKIYINREPVTGPWGGGNKFVSLLSEHVIEKGYNVTFDLEKDVDLIFCFDPRPNNKGVWYQDFLNCKLNFGTKIIQRVGDVGTHSKPELTTLVKASVQHSDFIIFPSAWSKNFINYDKNNYQIIENAPHSKFFKDVKNKKSSEKLRVVTHHWSTNEKKGFDYYEFLGKNIKEKLVENVEFTFIGRFNEKYKKEGINIVQPMDMNAIAIELKNYDLYLTASLEEAGANHVLEAIASNLPILYREGGGSIEEYCSDYGIKYSSMKEMVSIIQNFKNIDFPTKVYNRSLTDVIIEYEKIISRLT